MNTSTVSRSDFRVSACVDWVRVTIYTARETQFRYIRDELNLITGGNFFADPLDKQAETGQNATVFDIKFHDGLANDPLALLDILNTLSARFPFAAPPTLSGMEVACDFRHKGRHAFTLWCETQKMAYRLQSSLFAPGATKPRQYDPFAGNIGPDGDPLGGNVFMDFGTRINPALNYRIGNKLDDFSWQTYFKSTDHNKQPIDIGKWRARVEVTIQGQALRDLGLNSLSDLHGFRFTRLTPHFRFRRPIALELLEKNMGGNLARIHALKLNRPIHDATSARGIASFEGVGYLGKRNKQLAESRHLEPDTELQDAVKGALKRLCI